MLDAVSAKHGVFVRGLIYTALVGVAATLVCGLGLGAPHLRGDEEIYAQVVDEMLESADWLAPTFAAQPYVNKPPLYLWLAALSRSIVSDLEQAQRTPAMVFAVLTLMAVVVAGGVIFNPEVGLAAAFFLLLHEHLVVWTSHGFRRGTMESGLCFLAIVSYLMATRSSAGRGSTRWWIGVGVVTALMSMLKPFVGFLWFVVLAVAVLADARWARWRMPVAEVGLGFAASVVVWAPWHLWLWLHTPRSVLVQGFDQQIVDRVAGGIPQHIQGPLYYLVQITVSSRVFWLSLPVVVIALVAMGKGVAAMRCRSLAVVITLWVAGLSVAASKLLWYAFPIFPLLALLTVAEIDAGLRRWYSWHVLQRISLFVRTVAVVGLSLLAGAVLVYGYAGKVEFLARQTQYLPWTVYSELSTRSQPPDRVLVVGETQKRGGYYRRRMGAQTVTDPDQLRMILDQRGSALVIPGVSLADDTVDAVELELTARAAVRLIAAGQELYLVP